MLLNWLQTLITVVTYLWPFRRVEQWERGVYYIWARWWERWPARELDGTIGPGIWPIIPFFTEIQTTTAVQGVTGTPLLQVTARDGTPITFSVAMTWRIYDSAAAWNNTDRVLETGQELLAAVCAEKLAEVEPTRLDGDKRRRLVSDMLKWVNKEMEFMGCEASAIRFTNFAIGHKNIRTLRLLMDPALLTDFNARGENYATP